MTDMGRTQDALDRRISAWLDEGPRDAPASFVTATLAPIPAMAQRRRSFAAVTRMPTTWGRAFGALGIAAAVVLAVGLSVGLVTNLNQVGGSPSPSPSALAFADEGLIGANGSDRGRAGTYQSRIFRPRIVFTVPAGWSIGSFTRTFIGGGESTDGLPLNQGTGAVMVVAPASIDPPHPDTPGSTLPPDLAAWLAADPNLTLSPAVPVTIGGIAGVQMEGTLSAGARLDPEDGPAYRPFNVLPLEPRLRFRFQVITVRGQPIVIVTEANVGDFAAFRPLADELIATFRFPEPPATP
jgi:hypothetical protein